MYDLVLLLHHVQHMLEGPLGFLYHSQLRQRVYILREIAYDCSFWVHNVPSVNGLDALEHLEEGGFSSTISAHKAYFIVCVDQEGNSVKHDPAAKVKFYIRNCYHLRVLI